MTGEHKDEEVIFKAALKLESAAERAGFLRSACRGDEELLARVEALLKVHYEDKSFLKSPAGTDVTFDDSPLTEGPGTVIGRYKLLQQIGEGGFGVVYMAEQREPIRRRVALKIIKLGMDTKQVIARFEAERQALALMEHPNIAKVLDAGATETGRPYFVMELVKGISITEYCDKNNLDTQQRLELFIDVCKAVQHAHQKGIIHRDIKPTNVMITLHDGIPVPKVIDFGIAKATQQRLTEKTLFTEFKQFIGTPEYMSPEQAEMSGLDIDTRSDIYSLGGLLYELLTGTTPFSDKELRGIAFDEIRRIIREDEPPKPSTRLSTLGDSLDEVAKHRHMRPERLFKIIRGDLDWIVMKTLEKDRTQRYETANELALDIQRYLDNEMVSAGPPTLNYRMRKWARRHKTVCTISAAVFLFIIVFLTGAMIQRHLIWTRLNIIAERGLADVKVALAEGNYSNAQNKLTLVKAELGVVPDLMGLFEPRLNDLLGKAESKLLFQRYQTLADEARFSAQPLLGAFPEHWDWTDEQIEEHLREAENNCNEALGIFDVTDNPNWLSRLEDLSLEPDEISFLKRSLAEIMFLLSNVSFQLGEFSEDPAANTEQAIELLDQVEVLAPNLKSLYEYRSSYLEALGKEDMAKEDIQRAKEIEPATWIDHWLLALKFSDDWKHDESVDHVEKALALKVDEYWNWYAWGILQEWIIGDIDEGREARRRCHWAMSICINLRPREAAAWIARSHEGRIDGRDGSEMALADIKEGLELTADPGMRGLAYFARSVILEEMGQFEEAVVEIRKAIELRPKETEPWLKRYKWYRKAGRQAELRAETPRVLEIFGEPEGNLQHLVRLEALEVSERWEEMVKECLEVETKKFPLNLFPGGSYAKLGLACVKLGEDYLTSGQFDKVLEPYDEVMGRDMKATIAEVLVMGPDIREPQIALPYILEAIEAKPDWFVFYRTLGIVYYRLGQYEQAIEAFDKAIDLRWGEGSGGEESFFMAMAHWHLGNKEQARSLYYEGAEQLARANPEGYFADLLLPYQYEAAKLLGIPGAARPKPAYFYEPES